MPQYKFTPHSRQMIISQQWKRKQVCLTHGVGRTWDYILRMRAEEERNNSATWLITLLSRSSRPHSIRIKQTPSVLTDSENYLISLYEKHHHPGYQKFYLYCLQDNTNWKWVVSERDIKKLYERKWWIRKKKEKEETHAYVKESPWDMAHNDIKYLPRIEQGKDRPYFQEVIDDHTRVATACILMNKTAETAKAWIEWSLNVFLSSFSLSFQKLLTDNGAETSYNTLPLNKRPKLKKHPVAQLLEQHGIVHTFTRVCRPQTNGKSERLHKTLDDEVLSQFTFTTQEEMFTAIEKWLKWYNEERIHMSLRMTPLQKMLELNPHYTPPKSYLHIIR